MAYLASVIRQRRNRKKKTNTNLLQKSFRVLAYSHFYMFITCFEDKKMGIIKLMVLGTIR